MDENLGDLFGEVDRLLSLVFFAVFTAILYSIIVFMSKSILAITIRKNPQEKMMNKIDEDEPLK